MQYTGIRGIWQLEPLKPELKTRALYEPSGSPLVTVPIVKSKADILAYVNKDLRSLTPL
jgi:hypothetical protein